MKKEQRSSKTRTITPRELQKMIKEELARGIPDYAFDQPIDDVVRTLADYFRATLIKHINHSVSDPSIRNRKYSAAAAVARSIVTDRDLKKFLDEKLKEKLLTFLDEAR